jgi:lysozyme family protein
MADFLTAYKLTAINEGGYSNAKDDSGGETWEGISRNNFPTWIGWSVIDGCKRIVGFPENLKTSKNLEGAVQSFYRANFWQPMRGNEINDQQTANEIYDMEVNSGVTTGIKLAQQTAGIPQTGHMDDNTLNHLNNKV